MGLRIRTSWDLHKTTRIHLSFLLHHHVRQRSKHSCLAMDPCLIDQTVSSNTAPYSDLPPFCSILLEGKARKGSLLLTLRLRHLTVYPGLTFDQIGKAIGKGETWVAAAFYAQVYTADRDLYSPILIFRTGQVLRRGIKQSLRAPGYLLRPSCGAIGQALVAEPRYRPHASNRPRPLSTL